ncbi:hypothetical protein K466DRAFT_600721 [Polyporus arcularius HHB13444]|uniref:Uncharacterized protein n=1 Tax=Polyporus arcularius HHB13444 TaxID=1314778 RepID=A0A5C3PBG9_9APHY|nr:hypothetical protein K466DRAFT_600721 [Polyporus arcularius HHB13444]
MPKVTSPRKNRQTEFFKNWLNKGGERAPKTPQRDTWGWESRVPENITTNQLFIKEQYDLTVWQLDGVKSVETLYDGRKGRAYYEKDVEWRAWEVHGGPVGLWHIVKKKLKEHIAMNRDPAHFHAPYDYQPGGLYNVFLDEPPRLPDRYCHGSSILQHCKSKIPGWAWDKCNKALNDALSQTKFSIVLPGAREMAMLRAVTFICAYPEYATRPPGEPLVIPPHLYTLAAMLECAAQPPPDPQDWDVVALPDSCTLDVRANRFDWNANYLEALFAAILDAVNERVDDPEPVWKTARWMVYDKYVTIFSRGLQYDRDSKTWSDGAREWLEGRMSEDALRGSLRGACESGRRYNELLPGPRAGPPSSSAPPAMIPEPESSSSSTAVAGPSTAPY